MFGTLRLVLAALVAAFHSGATPGDIWIGVSAVVVFFMISGYAMTGLIEKRFPTVGAAPMFFLERLVRLAPQYYAWLLAVLFCDLVLRWLPIDRSALWQKDIYFYLAVFPLGLQPYTHMVTALLMPQATSLGIEVVFYLVSPIMLTSRIFSYVLATISLAIYIISAFKFLTPNLYTYYAAPGPIIFYLIGSFLYKKDWKAVIFFASALLLTVGSALSVRFNLEIALGVAGGLPALWLLRRLKPTKWDDALGSASYGCFLAHTLVITALQHFGIFSYLPLAFQGTAVVVSVVLGWASFLLLERPTIPFRRRLRAHPTRDVAANDTPIAAGPTLG